MEIKAYQPNDEVEIVRLFNLAFQRELSIDYWRWRFAENPFLKEPMINLMWEGEMLIGHHAVSASEIIYKNEICLSSLCGTAMTHPDFEGRGIYGQLALSLYDRISKDYGVNTIITFPNRAASHYSLVKKIKYNNVAYLPTLKLHSKLVQEVNTSGVSLITKFEKDHSEFIHKTIQDLGFEIYTNRSVIYLNWRYINCPINKYFNIEYRESGVLKGILIAKVYKTNQLTKEADIDIVDIFCSEDLNVMTTLFYGILKTITDEGFNVQNLNCWISLFDKRHLEMERLRFVMSTPITYLCVKPLGKGFEDVNQFNKWYISMADSDIY